MKNNIILFTFILSVTCVVTSCMNLEPQSKSVQTTIDEKKETNENIKPKSIPYKAAIAINICNISAPEVGEDIGYYLMLAEDALKKIGVNTQYLSEETDLKNIVIKSDEGTIVKTIDISSVVNKDNCVGFLVARDGVEYKFIELDPIKTEQQVVEYFK